MVILDKSRSYRGFLRRSPHWKSIKKFLEWKKTWNCTFYALFGFYSPRLIKSFFYVFKINNRSLFWFEFGIIQRYICYVTTYTQVNTTTSRRLRPRARRSRWRTKGASQLPPDYRERFSIDDQPSLLLKKYQWHMDVTMFFLNVARKGYFFSNEHK